MPGLPSRASAMAAARLERAAQRSFRAGAPGTDTPDAEAKAKAEAKKKADAEAAKAKAEADKAAAEAKKAEEAKKAAAEAKKAEEAAAEAAAAAGLLMVGDGIEADVGFATADWDSDEDDGGARVV